MKTYRWVSLAIALAAVGCGGGGSGGGGGTGSGDAFFTGPLMYINAQMHIYGSDNLQLADFNDDGFPELLYEVTSPAWRTIFAPGSETELFGTEQTPRLGVRGAVADFDGDGNLDIFSRVSGLGILSEWSFIRGNGDNTFEQPEPSDPSFEMGSVVVADINGDGSPDLLGRENHGTITPLINQGDATFVAGTPTPFSTGLFASADLNHDTFDDIVRFPLNPPDTVQVYLSLGDGTFGDLQETVVDDTLFEGPLADLNNDGNPDVLGHTETGVVALLGAGDGTFPQIVPTDIALSNSGGTATAAIADFNRDEIPDLVFISTYPTRGSEDVNSVYFALGNGDGTFASTPTLIGDAEFGPGAEFGPAVTMDVDRDGNLDLLITVNDGSLFLRPYFGNGDGTFRDETPQSIELTISGRLVPERTVPFEESSRPLDVDADGNLDLVVHNNGDTLGVFFGNGDLTFQPEERFPLNQTVPRLTVDMDVDGDVDFFGPFAMMSHWYNALRNYGGGELAALPGMFTTSITAQLVQLADLDQDTLPDLIFDFENGDLGVMYNLGDMQFEPMDITPAPSGGRKQNAADVTGDGYLDIIGTPVPSTAQAQILVLPGGPGRAFGTEVSTAFAPPVPIGDPADIFLVDGDFNGDDRADIVWVQAIITNDALATVKVFRGESNGTLTKTQDIFLEDTVLEAKAIDLDDDTDLDLVVYGLSVDDIVTFKAERIRLHCFLNDGSGQFEASDHVILQTGRRIFGWHTWDVVDVNADEYPDLISYSTRIGLGIALGAGDGTFLRANYFRVGGGMDSSDSTYPVIGDFDNDSDADFAVTWAAGGSIEFIENRLVQE